MEKEGSAKATRITYIWSGKTALGCEAIEQVDAESPIEARKILEARGWTELRQLSTDINNDSPASPTERPEFQQGAVPAFWSGWLAELRKSPAFFILLVIFLILGIRLERTQLERAPGAEAWIFGVVIMLAAGVFAYPVSYWWYYRRKKRKTVGQEETRKSKPKD